MASKLHTLIFLSTLLSCAFSTCSKAHFTLNTPCDTKAALLHCKEFISSSFSMNDWNYYYLPLDGIEGNIELDFKTDSSALNAYIRFQPKDRYTLPTDTHYNYKFDVRSDLKEIPSQILTHGMEAGGRMLLGIENPRNSEPKIEIRYYTTEGSCQRPLAAWLLGLIIGLVVMVVVACCAGVGVCIYVKITGAHHRPGPRIHPDIFQQQAQNNPDLLTAQDLQKYFPKKSFEKLENPFHQTGCSVCLDDFSAATVCHQLYCNHIFHEACAQQWLAKHNSCPECRVAIGKKAVEEFLKAKKKKNEENKNSPAAELKLRIPVTPGQSKINEEEIQTLTLH